MDGGLVTIWKIDVPQWVGDGGKFAVAQGCAPCTLLLRTLNVATFRYPANASHLHRHGYTRTIFVVWSSSPFSADLCSLM